MTLIYLLLGSNTGALDNLRRALVLLRENAEVAGISSVYRSAAQREAAGGEDFLNMAVALHTSDTPTHFKMDVLRKIEQSLGRERGTGNVVIDLDILLWGDAPFDYSDGVKTWHSPHPDLLRYGYAAVPLAEIAPEVLHPETGEPLCDIAERLGGDVQPIGKV